MVSPTFGQGTAAFEMGAGRTGEKPQAKVWFHDGAWWCVLPHEDAAQTGHRIHRFDGDRWVMPEGADIDGRVDARADVLCQGNALFVMSFHRDGSRFVAFDYHLGDRRYALREGFPVVLDSLGLLGVETLSFRRDSTGRFWAAFEGEHAKGARGEVRVIWSKDTAGQQWDLDGVRLGVGLDADDIAAVCQFVVDEIPQIGVIWSQQSASKSTHRDSAGTNRLWMRVHRDGDAPKSWSVPELIASGVALTDDHLNTAVARDGTVYLVNKTSLDDLKPRDPELPLLMLYARDNSGTWTRHAVSPGRERGTRPIVVLDDERGFLHVFYSRLVGEDQKRRQIVRRQSRRTPIAFGAPEVVVADPDMSFNDPTATHQRLTTVSGMLVMCWGQDHVRKGSNRAFFRVYNLDGG